MANAGWHSSRPQSRIIPGVRDAVNYIVYRMNRTPALLNLGYPPRPNREYLVSPSLVPPLGPATATSLSGL